MGRTQRGRDGRWGIKRDPNEYKDTGVGVSEAGGWEDANGVVSPPACELLAWSEVEVEVTG